MHVLLVGYLEKTCLCRIQGTVVDHSENAEEISLLVSCGFRLVTAILRLETVLYLTLL